MSSKIGRWQMALSAGIGGAAAWLLELPPAVSAALGVLLVPAMAVTDDRTRALARPGADTDIPPRGLCRCGHLMSMHCGSDSSGPCAVADCRCGDAGSYR